MFNIPIIGVVEPTARAAAMATKNKNRHNRHKQYGCERKIRAGNRRN
ncbi:MAG: hypothetical protein L6V93_21430 [Clostridiales bacterium]|nr:MAG: hypothetical protein L6V93_21430 [Clostridiales bacterium]